MRHNSKLIKNIISNVSLDTASSRDCSVKYFQLVYIKFWVGEVSSILFLETFFSLLQEFYMASS